MSFARHERTALAQLFRTLGPDAPTLCSGWTTAQLAAHLLVRETDIKAAAGIIIPRLAANHQAAMEERLTSIGYESIVEQWAAGPPPALRPVDAIMNTAENFVHHEDVRRAQPEWSPRELTPDQQRELYTVAKRMGRALISPNGATVACVPTTPELARFVLGDKHKVFSPEDTVVTVIGDIAEITLWLFDRQPVDVKIIGDECAVKCRQL